MQPAIALSEGGEALFLAATLEAQTAGRQYTFAVLTDGEFVGLMGLNDVRQEEGTASPDYWIGFTFWGRGIATRAASLVIAHAFQDLGLQTLFSRGLIRNPASPRFIEKNGFTKFEEHAYGGPWKDRFGGEMLARYCRRREEWFLCRDGERTLS